MTKQKTTKRALMLSALSLLMCVSMLIGTTFAWFTDSVTSTGNKIKAGNLDIQLLMADSTDTYNDISDSTKPIFGVGSIAQNNNAETLWEPGKTQVAYLAIKNNGNLALKYKVALNVENVYKNLYEVMEYDIIADAKPDSVKKWERGNSVVEGMQIITTDVPLAVGATHYFALAIHMNEEAGNDYQEGQVNFDLTVLATQDTVESDSFNNQYDKDATYSLIEPFLVSAVVGDYKAKVEVPAGSAGGNYSLDIPKDKVELTNDAGKVSLKFDMSLLNDGNKVSSSGVEYPVTIQLSHPFVDVEEILHNGVPVNNFTFDTATCTISFTTTNFSPFEIKYNDYVDPSFHLEYTNENDQYHITKGMFVGKNPVDFDASLENADSEYMSVSYSKNGVTYYAVSERATTLIVAADDAVAFLEGKDEAYYNGVLQKNVNASLWKAFVNDSRAFKLGANTIYILPGTYNEATTLSISTDMTVVGLGDAEDIKIVKIGAHSTTTKKPSNRHLFDVSGAVTLEKHIQVTIRNLYLDATENNTYMKNILGSLRESSDDNAAVQAIRLSKVKCYDLIVNDGNYPFYVNGGYDARGTYMYVENCKLIGNIATDSTPFATPCALYYDNLTYSNGTKEFTTNNTYYKEQTMAADNWDW